jgi:hypothetical protein
MELKRVHEQKHFLRICLSEMEEYVQLVSRLEMGNVALSREHFSTREFHP